MLYLQMLPSPSEKDKFEQIYTLYRGLMFYVARRICVHNRKFKKNF